MASPAASRLLGPIGGFRYLWPCWRASCFPSSMTTPAAAQSRSIPSPGYDVAFGEFYDGDYRAALDRFTSEGRGAIKTFQSRWIDSICYETMVGECYYEMGHLRRGLGPLHRGREARRGLSRLDDPRAVAGDPAGRGVGAAGRHLGHEQAAGGIGLLSPHHVDRPGADRHQPADADGRSRSAGHLGPDPGAGNRSLHGLGHSPANEAARPVGHARSALQGPGGRLLPPHRTAQPLVRGAGRAWNWGRPWRRRARKARRCSTCSGRLSPPASTTTP